MKTDSDPVVVEGEVLPNRESGGRIAEQGILTSLRMMNTDEKFELLKQTTKILNARTRRMNKVLRAVRAKIRASKS